LAVLPRSLQSCSGSAGAFGQGQVSHIDPARSDYIDQLLTVAMVFLGAVGLTVTLGALVIGLVALKTLRQIKDEAASEAKRAAAARINETVENDLDPKVDNNVRPRDITARVTGRARRR